MNLCLKCQLYKIFCAGNIHGGKLIKLKSCKLFKRI
jgi:hypothetical protein